MTPDRVKELAWVQEQEQQYRLVAQSWGATETSHSAVVERMNNTADHFAALAALLVEDDTWHKRWVALAVSTASLAMSTQHRQWEGETLAMLVRIEREFPLPALPVKSEAQR
jgi:hypothetical protein